MKQKLDKLVIIDAHALIHRAYHALPPSLTSPTGEPLNAVYGFTSVLIKVLRELSPQYVVAAFDVDKPTFRHKEFSSYKGTRRETDVELTSQVPHVKTILENFGILILEKEGFEADDVIGTVAKSVSKNKNLTTIIVTGDMDTLQLVRGDSVVVYTLRKGVTDTVVYNETGVRERFGGLGPENMTDYKGLKGDPSDNIPGVPGIGEKTAVTLLQKYGTLEKIFKSVDELKGALHKKLSENQDQAFFSRELATIRTDVPVKFELEDAAFSFELTDSLKKTLSSYGFKSLIARLEGAGTSVESQNTDTVENDVERYFKSGVFSDRVYRLEKELSSVLKRMEKVGFRIDIEKLNKLSRLFAKEIETLEKKAYKLAGENFNLGSPQEVGRLLFEKLDLGKGRVKMTRTGKYSTAAGELEKMMDRHPIVKIILQYRELSKIKSTYLDSLPLLIDPKDGRVHTTFRQFGAATGRLSSENPNLQNIPIRGDYGMEVRKAFIPRDGYLILSADYTQLELRIAASLSEDKTMIEAFKKGEDIHTRTAAEVFGIKQQEVTKEMRRQAKVLNFGVLYGMGSRAFSEAASIPVEESKRFIAAYRTEFPRLQKFLDETKSFAYANGYVETLWGRKRFVPELSSQNQGLRAAGERIAINMPIQGTAADIIKAAMVEIDSVFGKNSEVFMMLQVHDELVFEVKKGKETETAKKIASLMSSVIELKVPLTIDVEVGPSWGELQHVEI